MYSFKKLFNRLLILHIVLYSFGTIAMAQFSALKFEHITIAKGLSQSSVFSITEDSYGFMWFGTRTGGLNKFDGYNFTVYRYNQNDPHSISGNEIISLLDDEEGNLWVGTRNTGLNKFNFQTGHFQKYFSDTTDRFALPNNTVNAIYKDKSGTIWLGTNSGLCIYNQEQDHFIPLQNITTGISGVKAIVPSANSDHLWLGSKTGLYLYSIKDNSILDHYQHNTEDINSLSQTNVTCLLEDKKARLWIGTYSNGLNRLDNKTGKFIHYKNDLKDNTTITSNVIRTIYEDIKGTLWIGTKIALEQLVPEQQEKEAPVFIHHIKDEGDPGSLNQNSIFSFFEDSKGNFWMGTYNGGVNYLSNAKPKFEHYKHNIYEPTSLGNNVVSSFAVNDNEIWVGTEGGGLDLFNRETGRFTHYIRNAYDTESLNSNHVKSLLIDSDNKLWIGTHNGLHLYDRKNNSFIHYLAGSNIYAIEEGTDNELWIASTNKLFKYNKTEKQFKVYENIINDPKSLSNNAVISVYIDSKGTIWIATKKGLNVYNPEEDNFRHYMHNANDKTSLSHSHITNILEDNNGQLWIGTFDGLNKYDTENDRFYHYGLENGIPGNVINNLQVDDDGYLWITTNSTLTRFNPITSTIVNNSENENESLEIRNYDADDGLQNGEFRLNGSYKHTNGEIYLGGVDGFNIFHPDSVRDNLTQPEVYLTDLKLFNKSVVIGAEGSILKKQLWQTESITLNYDQSVFTFYFVALNYTSSDKNQYAYKMEGIDPEWNYVGNRREATYTSLPAGKYVFRVKASNNDGIWNEKGSSIEVIILPPWWKTWWFRISAIITILIIISSIYLYRITTLKLQKRALEKMVRERTSELQEVNTQLEEKHEEIVVQQESILEKNEELKTQKDKIEEAYNNVETLSKIGKQITMSLAVESIIDITYMSLQSMMEVPVFSIGLFETEHQKLTFKGAKQEGVTIADYEYSLKDVSRMAVWCFNSQHEVLINDFNAEYKNYVPKIVKPAIGHVPQSLIYIPLNVKDKRIGVISVQSGLKNQYTKYHQNILQNIGIYAAIAFDNAAAYDKIEKQASSLVEINKKLHEKQYEIQIQNQELTDSEEEMAQLNEELSSINEQLMYRKSELEGTIEQLKDTQMQLVQSEKMASIGLLTAGVAHEINNPLNFIKGGKEGLKGYLEDKYNEKDAEIDSLFEIIDTGVKRAADIVNSLNRFSRKSSNNSEKCDIHAIIDNCLTILENQLKHKVEIEKHYASNKFVLSGNEGELHQVMVNILSNAEQSIEKKGKISIFTELVKGNMVIRFIDDGCGISEPNLSKITEPFFTTKDPGEGTGLGLSISSSILEKYKGSIEFDSKLGKGTIVIVKLPVESVNS